MEFGQLFTIALGSIITGVISAWASSQIIVAKLSVHVDVIRERIRDHDEQFRRVHQRLDNDAACRYPEMERRSNGAGH